MTRFFVFFLFCATVQLADAKTASQVSQYGITWYFDKAYECDTFANGDYWVLGPVTITKITPEFTGKFYGYEVDPVYKNPQGFDIRIGPNVNSSTFDAKLAPALPLTVTGLKSVVKAVGRDTTQSYPRPVLQKAAVLTVVAEIPPGRGLDVFRPPYVGTEKPYYYIKNIQSNLLPKFAPIADMPTIDSLYRCFKMVQMDHKDGSNMAWLRPFENIGGGGYAPTMAMFSNDAIIRLMMNDPVAQKMKLLIAILQKGIDMYHFALAGQVWPDGSGYQVGHLLPMVFTAVMLNNEPMKTFIKQATFFMEDQLCYAGAGGKALFGLKTQYWTEKRYWEYLVKQSGGNSERDPYGLIDGGYDPGGEETYLNCCLAQPFKGSALAFQLFPELKKVWNNAVFFAFADRWVAKGLATQPDTCAPADGICKGGPNNGKPCTMSGGCPQGACSTSIANYGKTFGSNSKGGCIKDADPADGTGRFPSKNNTGVDAGMRWTSFQKDMWIKYRNARVPSRDSQEREAGGNSRSFGGPANSVMGLFSRIDIVNTQGRVIGVVGSAKTPAGSTTGIRAVIAADGVYFFVCRDRNRRVLVPVASVQ
jgi:hypothetical protein